ncbi:MAG: GntR family transcriptional regulator [Azospirillaceae bacterium]
MSSRNADKATVEALRKSQVSRYLQLASMFRGRIESGKWPVGARIPTVGELADQCGVAVMTIRQALNLLESEGLIERFRGKGSFVRAQPKRELWCEVETDWSGLLMARENAKIEVLSDERVDALPDNGFGLVPGGVSYRHLNRRHSRQGVVFLLADVYLAEPFCDSIPPADLSTKTAMRLVADLPGVEIGDARQLVTVETADLVASTELNVPLGSAVVRIQRMAATPEGRLVLFANGIYRGDMVRIEMKLR